MNPVKLVLPHLIVPEQDNSPGNSLIVFNEHGWLRACFGEKEGAGNCENSENARLICKGNEVDIKHGYCLPLNLPSLISLDALFKVSLKFSKSSFCMSQHRWHSILFIQRRIYVLCNILLNRGSYITEEVMLPCFNRYCDERILPQTLWLEIKSKYHTVKNKTSDPLVVCRTCFQSKLRPSKLLPVCSFH